MPTCALVATLGVSGGSMLRVPNLNCNGIRRREKRLQLGELRLTNRIGVAIITETHLRIEEVKRLHSSYHAVVNDSSRVTDGKIGGGVLPMVRRR